MKALEVKSIQVKKNSIKKMHKGMKKACFIQGNTNS